MPWDTKTLTQITQTVIYSKDDLYPDLQATPNDDGTYSIRDNGATVARLSDEVPSTAKDISAAFQWQPGDKLYGTFAKKVPALKEYRADMIRAKDKEVEDFFVDTLSKKPLKDQLKNMKRI